MAYLGVGVSFSLTPFYFKHFRAMNPYWMLPGCLFQAVGGGIPVTFSMLYAIAADVTDEKNRRVPASLSPRTPTNTSAEARASSCSWSAPHPAGCSAQLSPES